MAPLKLALAGAILVPNRRGRRGLIQGLGGMYQETGQIVYATWAIWVAIAVFALSGLYPAKKLHASAKTAFWSITGLTAVAPLLFLIYDRLRLYVLEGNNPSGLKNMRVPIDQLPWMYALSAAVAALLFWLVFAWRSRSAA